MKEVKLDKTGFLTPEELMKHQSVQQSQPPIPDLHDANGALPEEVPAEFVIRNKIKKDVDEVITKDSIRSEMYSDAISDVNNKYAATPETGLDILKKIITFGDYKEAVELFGYKWTLRALDQMDDLTAIDEMSIDYGSNIANMTAYAFNQVVFSIEEIEGQSIYEIFKEVDRTKFNRKLDYMLAVKRALRTYLLQFPPYAITELHAAYKKVDAKRNEAFDALKKS